MARLLLICLGGAVGTGARYWLSTWCRDVLGASFPYGTLAVNVVGSFLLGVIMYVGLNSKLISMDTRLILGTGVMGGFTTYSSFNWETLQLFQEWAFRLAFTNLLVTLVGCFLAGWAGLALARRLVSGY